MSTANQILTFQAEANELLNLMVHSLYTDKDIFLRELVSNASDALDHLHFESLKHPELLEGNNILEIVIEVDPKSRTLTISDTGIGMSREELIRNIGTIAKSGTREIRETFRQVGSEAEQSELIGQFGVGFYSAFMVADKVTLITRRADETKATEWESVGDGTYTVRESAKPSRGTRICLSLKPVDKENGIGDYTDRWCVSAIVKKHSDFIQYPILIKEIGVEKPVVNQSRKDDVIDVVPETEAKPINSMKPIWDRPYAEVKSEEYAEFYKHVAHDWSDPLKTIHFKAEGTFEYKALLFIPKTAPYDLYHLAPNVGLHLFARRVMIMEKCEDLLPKYLRFVRGIVDAADLPLNISRQRLQEDRHITLIQRRLTRKLLDTFQQMFENEPEAYLSLWREFGRAIKEGVGTDYDNRDKLLPLLLFHSSFNPEKLTSLRDYVARMKPEQEHILYLTGESRHIVEHAPHLEAARENGYEVLYLIEAVDELLLQYLTEFDGKKLKSLGKGAISLLSGAEKEKAQKGWEQKQEEYRGLMDFLQKELSEHIKQVRLSERLTSSPTCLVVEEHDYSPMLERALHRGKEAGPKQKRVLELNPHHPLISRLRERHQENEANPILKSASGVLLGLALLVEGSQLPDPVQFNRAASEVLTRAI